MGKMGLSKDQRSEPAALDLSCLLRHLAVKRPNHVWCADITYIPMQRGFLYLVAITTL